MRFDHMTLNITVIKGHTVMILGWTGLDEGPSLHFAESFINLPDDQKANATMHIAFEHLDNIYIRPSWWRGRSASEREYLDERFKSGLGPGGNQRQDDCLASFKYDLFKSKVVQLFRE